MLFLHLTIVFIFKMSLQLEATNNSTKKMIVPYKIHTQVLSTPIYSNCSYTVCEWWVCQLMRIMHFWRGQNGWQYLYQNMAHEKLHFHPRQSLIWMLKRCTRNMRSKHWGEMFVMDKELNFQVWTQNRSPSRLQNQNCWIHVVQSWTCWTRNLLFKPRAGFKG